MKSSTGIVLGLTAGLVVIGLLFDLWWLHLVVVLIGLISISKAGMNVIATWWMKFAGALGWINSRILLGVIYFVLLLPLAMLTKGEMRKKFQLVKSGLSTYMERNHTYTKTDLKNPW